MEDFGRVWRLALSLTLIVSAIGMPQNPRSPAIGETLKQLTVSLLESINATAPTKYQDPVPTFDTRTPPKVKQQMKKDKLEEKSHPGIAEPVDDEELILEEHEKKMNYYKVDRPTTDSGLSTWILLSGQASSTAKPMKRPLPRNVTNTYVVEDEPVMNIKPLFKRRSTTKKPTATTAATTTTATTTTTTTTQRPTKLTKVKASLLAGVNKNATNFSKKTTTVKATTTTITTPKPTKATKVTTVSTTKKPTTVTTTKRPTTEFVRVSTMNTPVVINETRVSSAALAPEAKEGELDLTNNKKTRKPSTTHKRKKNKNKKRRPTAEDKVDVSNSTKVASKIKEKPFGTQIYNYLSREVMPTVGVGLVGLMVTAGLASYFLYPFSPVRRSYEVDRKDKVTPYYYNDEYSGGIAEEEAIGKVIAGMPQNANTNTNYNVRAQNSRNTYNRYRNVDQRYMQGSVETVKLNHKSSYGGDEVIVGSPKASYGQTTENDDEQKFVVGSIPKELQGNLEEVDPTPVVVPEHGPRNIEEKEQVFVVHSVPATETAALKIEHGPRRRRQSYEENEIDVDGHKTTETTIETTTTTPKTTTTNKPTLTTTKNPIVVKTESFIHLIKDLFYFKIRMGLEILQNKTETLTKYFKSAQTRIDDAYVKNHQPHM
ncbi:PREDICTED: uncharacterized protein LOC108557594 [Nicrophorus vespilloides]|uniref:Uncharacterized protein LOC108557594 n=1 Tax=Nicrophorus vespilloides TaxID=110193 RepID=A0ABM1M521_NICVS|nr:PREDICTED: uncharacterized protein LOC108557594 [Nicrophorus vespilloides]